MWDQNDPPKGTSKCPNCSLFVYHKPEKCYELEAKKTNRPSTWKSVKDHKDDTGWVVNCVKGKHSLKTNKMPIHSHNYFTLLTSQVEDPASPPTDHLCTSREITHDTQHGPYRSQPPKQVSFSLAPSHTDKDSHTWTQSKWTTCAPPRSLRHLQMSKHRVKQGFLNGSIPSDAWDTACTSNAGNLGGPFIPTALQSTKVFYLADGHPTSATTVALPNITCKRQRALSTFSQRSRTSPF